jgi:hypothetical protein
MISNNVTPKNRKWYSQHYWAPLLALASFTVAYFIGSRSLDTGSWQQYVMTATLLVFGFNRLGRAAHTTAKSLWTKKNH